MDLGFFPEHKEKLEQGFDEFARDNALNINKRYLVQCKMVQGYKYASDRGSGADKDLDLYKPSTSDSYKYVGVNGNSNNSIIVQEISTTHSAIREPTGWQQIWTDKNSGNDCDYNVWLPIAPPDYVALGVFCKLGFITIIRQVRVRLQVLWLYINHLDKNRFGKKGSLE